MRQYSVPESVLQSLEVQRGEPGKHNTRLLAREGEVLLNTKLLPKHLRWLQECLAALADQSTSAASVTGT